MRGQKSRTGIRSGFEGGQMPLYRRLPKLRGIAGGMPAGRKTHLTVNLGDIVAAVAAGKLDAGAEMSIEVLKECGLVSGSGKQRDLPLKVLADGDVSMPLKVKAAAFSAAAREKLTAAGGTAVDAPTKRKWTRALGDRLKAAAAANPAAAAAKAGKAGAKGGAKKA
jgi:large subunit ribosomal protein L15